MKFIYILSSVFFTSAISIAQTNNEPGETLCGIDSVLTNRLLISTGITGIGSSDSILLGCGYGGNVQYPTVNTNVDTFWTVTKFSSIYNPRPTGPFAYTGPYLISGGNPFIICPTGNPTQGYYDIFESSGSCSNNYANAVSHYISVYSDGGGQNWDIGTSPGDSYEYSRCFFICSNSTVTIDLKVLADDIVDSILIDNQVLYSTTNNSQCCNFYCNTAIQINNVTSLGAGKHVLRVIQRDNVGGHITLNVFGSVTTVNGSKSLIRSRFDSKCEATLVPTNVLDPKHENSVNLYPNPSNGHFFVSAKFAHKIEIKDITGRLVFKTGYVKGRTEIRLNESVGVYFVTVRNENDQRVSAEKIIIQ